MTKIEFRERDVDPFAAFRSHLKLTNTSVIDHSHEALFGFRETTVEFTLPFLQII